MTINFPEGRGIVDSQISELREGKGSEGWEEGARVELHPGIYPIDGSAFFIGESKKTSKKGWWDREYVESN